MGLSNPRIIDIIIMELLTVDVHNREAFLYLKPQYQTIMTMV